MQEKFKNRAMMLGVVLILIMFLTNVFLVNKINNMSNKFDNYESAISAINDTLKHSVENGFDVYSKKAPEIELKTLIESEYFKTLSADQKKFYKSLKDINGLISATYVELIRQGEFIDTLTAGTIKGDSISFALRDTLKFQERDTSKKLQWDAHIVFGKPNKFAFDYSYATKILTTYERQKDKSIIVKYKIDDPELKINSMQNFIIPTEQRTKLQKWLDKHKVPIIVGGGTALFVTGGIIGAKIAK